MSPGELDLLAFIDAVKACGAVQFGTFTLTSGRTSTYYVDIKKAVTRPDLLRTIADAIAPYARDADRIAGVELGAVPIAAAVSLASGKPYAMVRKATARSWKNAAAWSIARRGAGCSSRRPA